MIQLVAIGDKYAIRKRFFFFWWVYWNARRPIGWYSYDRDALLDPETANIIFKRMMKDKLNKKPEVTVLQEF